MLGAPHLRKYDGRFWRGWRLPVTIGGDQYLLDLLIPIEFPYAPPRVALASPDKYLKWPHVEDAGLLCLPAQSGNPDAPVELARQAFADACSLIDECTRRDNDPEFRREFVSYWNRQHTPNVDDVHSLLQPRGPTRKIKVWRGTLRTLVGECNDDLERWLTHARVKKPLRGFTFYDALLIELPQPPAVREYPDSATAFHNWIRATVPDAMPLLDEVICADNETLVVLVASTETGHGVCAVNMLGRARTGRVDGFRPGRAPPVINANRWCSRAKLERRKVVRINSSWIHGRELNNAEQVLRNKTVAVIGCGALGSHVAARLAVAGVGSLLLIDPEVLESANVGRHVLGVEDVGTGKAKSLASQISRRFPHMRQVRGIPYRWENLPESDWELVAQSDLIVSTAGEWSAEGPLNEWHVGAGKRPAIIYGWFEEFAAAAHALLITGDTSCLRCALNADGSARDPETQWEGITRLSAEPACGGAFQPFGPVEVAMGEAVVAQLSIEYLLGSRTQSHMRSYCTSSEQLQQLHGTWTERHKTRRPENFDGAFVSDRMAPHDLNCPVCENA